MKIIEKSAISDICVPGRSKSVGALVDDYKSAQSLGCTDLADDAVNGLLDVINYMAGRLVHADSQRFEASKSVRSCTRIF